MPVIVYPSYMGPNTAEPITVDDAETWRLGPTGSLQLYDAASQVCAEWAANQWGYVANAVA